jgi:hypothetical protein
MKHALVGSPEQAMTLAVMAFGNGQHFLMTAVRGNAALNSAHR